MMTVKLVKKHNRQLFKEINIKVLDHKTQKSNWIPYHEATSSVEQSAVSWYIELEPSTRDQVFLDKFFVDNFNLLMHVYEKKWQV